MIQVLVQAGAQYLVEGGMHYGPLYKIYEVTAESGS